MQIKLNKKSKITLGYRAMFADPSDIINIRYQRGKPIYLISWILNPYIMSRGKIKIEGKEVHYLYSKFCSQKAMESYINHIIITHPDINLVSPFYHADGIMRIVFSSKHLNTIGYAPVMNAGGEFYYRIPEKTLNEKIRN